MKTLQRAYIWIVTLAGLLLFVWALTSLPSYVDYWLLAQLALLNIVAQFVASSVARQGLVFGVSHAVNLAAVGLFGVETGVLLALTASLSVWLLKTIRKQRSWRGSLEQLSFNTGMEAINIFISGWFLVGLQSMLPQEGWFGRFVPWIIAAVANDQGNLWMVALIVYLQKKLSPIKFVWQSGWAMPINITTGAVGGVLLATVTGALGSEGIMIFLFPLLLSGYSFNMYVGQTEQQMDVIKQRTEELEVANGKMREMAREKDNMLAVLSHDMRTSISGIHASIQMLQDPTLALTREKAHRLLQVIAHSEQALTGMVDNILRVEKAEDTDKLLPQREFFNMTDVVAGVVTSLDTQAGEKRVRLHSYGGNVPAYIEADKQMIQQVALNLISNAIKYTPNGGSVFVSLDMRDDQVVLDVEDTGYGIPRHALDQIFEPYYRVEEHEKKALGTGLGLSIVKRFVNAHGGNIEVVSEVGNGSRFSVQLPMLGGADVHEVKPISPPNFRFQDHIPAKAISA